MAYPIKQVTFLDDFSCLGGECEDTCCIGWNMQMDEVTYKKYQQEAPQLLPTVEQKPLGKVMKCDSETGKCLQCDSDGWCGIHKEYGETMLGDACYFFPRMTRHTGETPVMTASLSCPEIARLALLSEAPITYQDTTAPRLPNSNQDIIPEELSETDAFAIHEAFIQTAADEDLSPARALASISSVIRSMERLDTASWPAAVPFYLKNAHSLPAPEENIADPFNLLHALAGLIHAASATNKPRLMQTVKEMETVLLAELKDDMSGITTCDESLRAYEILEERFENEWQSFINPILKRWLQAELSLNFFPFAGLGNTLGERITILGVRYATTRMALIACCQIHGPDHSGELIRTVQSLSRFLDHLAEPELSLSIYAETGWIREPRLRALIKDCA